MSATQFVVALFRRIFAAGRSPVSAGQIDFGRFEQVLGVPIRHRRVFVEALSHRSSLHAAGGPSTVSNERLEFLGDAILNLIVAEYLFRQNVDAPEGELTKIRARLVNRKVLAIYARELDLGSFLIMSQAASQATTRGMDTILADAFEAVIGAIYLDSGMGNARRFVERVVLVAVENGLVSTGDENFKSQLLEYTQASGLGTPRYIIIDEKGPDHDRTFTIEVNIGNLSPGIGVGKNKKDAEQSAAEDALRKLLPAENARSGSDDDDR